MFQCFLEDGDAKYLITQRDTGEGFAAPDLYRHLCEMHLRDYLMELARRDHMFCILSIIEL